MQTMQRFLKENYQKNLSLKFIQINNVMQLCQLQLYIKQYTFDIKTFDIKNNVV